MLEEISKKEGATGLILMGHGSRLHEANEPLRMVAGEIAARAVFDFVQPAFLELADPRFPDAVATLADKGASRIVIMPYFLYTGMHLKRDLPEQLDEARERWPDIEFAVAPNLGFHHALVDVTMERLSGFTNGTRGASREAAPVETHPIEAESFRIIEEEFDLSDVAPERRDVVKRVIHATADPEFARLLAFSPGAIEAGVRAIRGGASVITDVRMVEVGINGKGLASFGGRVRCLMPEKGRPIEPGLTRSAMAMRLAADGMAGAIVAVGNAPTALLELARLMAAGEARPALVVGVPVGFVGAAESKERLRSIGVEQISTTGRKGGSTVAAAIVNALIIKAASRDA